MNRRLIALLCVSLGTCPALADDTTSDSPAEQFEALVAEYEEVGGAAEFAERFFEFEEVHRDDPAAVSALTWILKRRRNSPDAIRAIELLETHHLQSNLLAEACISLARIYSTAGERLLRAILEQSPHVDVRAQACYWLVYLLEDQQRIAAEFRSQPELTDRMLQYYGREYGTHLTSLDTAEQNEKLEILYETMADSFSDVAIDDTTMGQIAEQGLFRIHHLSVGCVAPEIEGEDIDGEIFRLSDYRGKVVVLTFWGHW